MISVLVRMSFQTLAVEGIGSVVGSLETARAWIALLGLVEMSFYLIVFGCGQIDVSEKQNSSACLYWKTRIEENDSDEDDSDEEEETFSEGGSDSDSEETPKKGYFLCSKHQENRYDEICREQSQEEEDQEEEDQEEEEEYILTEMVLPDNWSAQTHRAYVFLPTGVLHDYQNMPWEKCRIYRESARYENSNTYTEYYDLGYLRNSGVHHISESTEWLPGEHISFVGPRNLLKHLYPMFLHSYGKGDIRPILPNTITLNDPFLFQERLLVRDE